MQLTRFQKAIVKDCLKAKKGCLSIPMGNGKTFIALSMSRSRHGGSDDRNKTLVIVTKSLISGWETEISKFFGDDLKFDVFYPSNDDFEPQEELVITTPQTISKYFKRWNLQSQFEERVLEDRGGPFPINVNRYHFPRKPLLKSRYRDNGGFLFSLNWKFVFIDELQEFTNIETICCQAISCIFSERKWGLSGTPFNEPSVKRILGYHAMLGFHSWPNSLPDTESFVKSNEFHGLNSTMVIRSPQDSDPEAPRLPPAQEIIVSHEMTREENSIYLALKQVLREMQKTAANHRLNGNEIMRRRFSAYLLAMITYTRQFLVCPLVPFATMTLTMMSTGTENELARAFMNKMRQLNLTEYLNDSSSVLSSRISKVLNVLSNHSTEKVLVFCCFVPHLKILQSFIENRPTFFMESCFSPKKRGQVLKQFAESRDGVMLMTFGLGAEGLNLQHCSTVLLMDVWWNCGKTQQAIARVLRRGQENEVTIYFFTSHTGIENALFSKHSDKLKILKELATGKTSSKISALSVDKILSLMEGPENVRVLESTRRLIKE